MPSKTAESYRRLLTRRLHRRPLLPFLLAATLAVEVVLLVADLKFDRLEDDFSLTVFAIFGYRFGQLGLVSLWLVSSRRGWFGRLVVAAAVVAWIARSLESDDPFNSFADWATLLGATLLMQTIFCFLVVLREFWSRGDRLMRERRQFSVGGLLLAMTVSAAAAAASRGVVWRLFVDWNIVFLACCEATFPAMLWWALARTRRRWFAVLVTFPLLLLGYSLSLSFVFEEGSPSLEWTVYIAAQGAVILLWVLALRSQRQPITEEHGEREELTLLTSEDSDISPASSIDLHG